MIIPVLDVLGGVIVHAVAGDRSRYQPIPAAWGNAEEPLSVVQKLLGLAKSKRVYVADLDALQGERGDTDNLAWLNSLPPDVEVLLDRGLRGQESRSQAQLARPVRLIHATESWCEDWPDFTPTDIVSLDLRAGELCSARCDTAPLQVLAEVIERGCQSVIVLDVAGVGAGLGPRSLDLCRAIRRMAPHLEIISGGGVRHAADVQAYSDAGCQGVLVATSLHQGKI
jgi:phosphoribosylformimino-5-aminoimidazole carboxamide ribotide isomerase